MPAAPPCTSVPFGRAPRAPRRRTPATARRHGAATAPALMVARTRCTQRTRVGAAAPVALRRWRRPHARGTRGRRPITVNRARPVRAPVATPAAFRHPRRQHWRIARRRMSSRRPTASSGRRGVVLCQCSGAPGTSSPTQASARARRMATAAASAGTRARSSGAPASMAATPVAIRRTRPRGLTWHCASTAAATKITRTRPRQCTPPRHRGACGPPSPEAATRASRAPMAATPRGAVLACLGTCGDGSDASGTPSPQTPTPAHRTATHVLSMADRIEWAPRR